MLPESVCRQCESLHRPSGYNCLEQSEGPSAQIFKSTANAFCGTCEYHLQTHRKYTTSRGCELVRGVLFDMVADIISKNGKSKFKTCLRSRHTDAHRHTRTAWGNTAGQHHFRSSWNGTLSARRSSRGCLIQKPPYDRGAT